MASWLAADRHRRGQRLGLTRSIDIEEVEMPTEIRLTVSPNDPTVTSQDLEELVLELKAEIEQSSNYSIPVNETQGHNEGALGPEWLPVLTAILSAPVAIQTVKSLFNIIGDWIKRRKPVMITIEGPKGKYVITGENMSGDEIQRVAAKIV
jgi:hypothetical protein